VWATSGLKKKKIYKIFRGSFRGAKFLMRMLSVFLRRFFVLSFGQKNFFSMGLLRPLVSVKKIFLKFLIFLVLKKLLKNLTS
jgi:hypothetical protein